MMKQKRLSFLGMVDHMRKNDEFGQAHYAYELFSYIERNNITERKDKIKIFKTWFLSGRILYVNGSARGRVVLKYQDELNHLIKIGFIKQLRADGVGRSNNTYLTLNKG